MKQATQDLTRLPRWAQWRISTLESNVRSLEASLAVRDAGRSDVALVDYDNSGRELVGLPPRSEVRFILGEERQYIEARVRERRPGILGLQLSCDFGQLVVRPSGGVNCLEVGVEGL